MKRSVVTKRRRIRCAAPVRKAAVVAEYLKEKEKYEKAVKVSQTESWKTFCGKQGKETVWEGIYRAIGRTTKRQEDIPLVKDGKVLNPVSSAKVLAEVFYPEDDAQDDDDHHRHIRTLAGTLNDGLDDGDQDPPFTMDELRETARSFDPRKAPGSDGLTADICQRAIQNNPGLYLALANKCLQIGHFPTSWKVATVVVLRKPGKEDYTQAKSYRPIGLLPVLGKILEKMVVGRVKWHLLPRTSTRQFGFMPQRSTEDSLYTLVKRIRDKLGEKKIVVLISLDIEGAFDSAWWPAIKVRLSEEGCPKNLRRVVDAYFESRKVKVRYAGVEHMKGTTKGCVQGSIGGPILWNLLLDPLLQGLQKRGDYCQAFADDIVMMFHGEETLKIQTEANAALAYVRDWGVKNKLRFAPHKTKAMVITRKLKYDSPLLHMGGVDIELSREIKILGLNIDDKLTFNTHVTEICKKAITFYNKLARAAKVQWGLEPEVVRTLYTAVVEPTILYAASAWAPAVSKLGVKKQLAVVQRGFVQKMTKAYRTVSLNSALLLAGILPLDLRVREAALLYEVKKGYNRQVTGDREVESPVAFVNKEHPAKMRAIQIKRLVDGAEMVQQPNDHIFIYTDGSRIDEKVGAALSIWQNGAETKTRKLKLESFCTVYQAELLALLKATEEVAKSKVKMHNIYCDSRSALETVASGVSLHPIAFQINKTLKHLNELGKIVDLFWIKAHAGMEGNERADELAKEAARKLKRKADYDKCPISFVKRRIRQSSLDEWDKRYKQEDTAGVTKLFFPDAIYAYKAVRKIEMDKILTQLFTGHGGFSEYLSRFRCKESPSCVCDPDVNETVVHLVTECPKYLKQRTETEIHIDTKIITSNLSIIMMNKEMVTIFLEYCKKVVCDANKRNK